MWHIYIRMVNAVFVVDAVVPWSYSTHTPAGGYEGRCEDWVAHPQVILGCPDNLFRMSFFTST